MAVNGNAAEKWRMHRQASSRERANNKGAEGLWALCWSEWGWETGHGATAL